MNTTFERVRALLAAELSLDPERIATDTPLEELGVDSLAALEFAFELEDAFDVKLDNQSDLRGGRVCDVVAAVDAAILRRVSTDQ